jgi:hypothetical protein
MPNSNCWLEDTNVQKQLEDYFQDVDRGLSTFYEGHPNTAEPQLDGHLAARLEKEDADSLQLHLNRINRERLAARLRALQLRFDVFHITPQEPTHGADIGLVLRVIAPREYVLSKAALVQAKRLHPSGNTFKETSTYRELFKTQDNGGHGKREKLPPQWERLLSKTPASVYFFYNPHQLHLKRTYQVLGTRVIPATYIAGIAPSPGSPNVNFTALDAFQRGKSLARWLVEDFICCGVGDTRPEIISTALGEIPEFPVRSTIQITIQTEDVNLNLWDQQR